MKEDPVCCLFPLPWWYWWQGKPPRARDPVWVRGLPNSDGSAWKETDFIQDLFGLQQKPQAQTKSLLSRVKESPVGPVMPSPGFPGTSRSECFGDGECEDISGVFPILLTLHLAVIFGLILASKFLKKRKISWYSISPAGP